MCKYNRETGKYDYQKVSDLNPKQIAILKRTMADLLTRANTGENIPSRFLGICANLREMLAANPEYIDSYDLVAELSNDWPKHQYFGQPEELQYLNGDDTLVYNEYPIKVTYIDEDEDDPEASWQGEQLKLRKELLAYMMHKLDVLLCGGAG